MAQQKSLLRRLMAKSRFARLFDAEILDPKSSYSAGQFLRDLQSGLWSELGQQQPKIVPLRRALQRAYLAHLKSELAAKKAAVAVPVRTRRGRTSGARSSNESDFRAVARIALQDLADQLDKAIPKAGDTITHAHLRDCRRELKTILDPKG